MSTILAIWNRYGEPVDEDVLRSMLAASHHPSNDGQDFWLQKEVALAHQHFWITPEEINERQPLVDSESGIGITCAARLDNRSELIHAFGLEQAQAKSLSDAQLILKAYQLWGTNCPRHLLGDFALVIWDPAHKQIFAARDALGCEELHYLLDQQYCLLATRITCLLEHPRVQPRLNETSIAEYLSLHWVDDINTFYDSINHLPPAHCLVVTTEGSRLWCYWEIDPDKKIRYSHPEEYGEHYLELIKRCLRDRLRVGAPLGISLSGGLDSSSLAVLAAEILAEMNAVPGRLGSYSYVFDAYPECDERVYIQPVIDQTARTYPIRSRTVNGDTLWPKPFADDWPILRDYPGQDPYHYLVNSTLKAAQADGVRLMLSGYYGDELYTGSETWFADLMLTGHFRQAVKIMMKSSRQGMLKEDVLNNGFRMMIPQGIKNAYRWLRPRPLAGWTEWIPADLARKVGLSDLNDPWLTHPKFRLPGRQRGYAALFFGGYSLSFADYQILAREDGMEFSFPYADRRIVEFMLALPSEQAGLPGYSRRVLRDALKDKLPEAVRQRQDKADFFPLFYKGLYDEHFPAIIKILEHSQVLERGFIRKDWLNGELEHRTWTREGLILWLLLCVETWLQKYW